MKIRISFLALALVGTLLLFSNTSCKKADIKTEVADVGEHTTTQFVTYSPANKKVPAGYVNSDNVAVQFLKGYTTLGDYPGCGDRAYLIDLAYNGFTTFHDVLLGEHTLVFKWTLSVPSGEIEPAAGTLNRGFFRFPSSPSGPAWRNAPAQFLYVGSHSVDDSGVPVVLNDYEVSYSFTFSDLEYCANADFHTYFRLGSDCSEFPFIQMVGTPSYIVDNFSPNTYNVYEFGASNGASPVLDIDFFALIPTPPPCHQPALGTSPSHEVRYRRHGSIDPWVTIPRTNLSSFSGPASISGTYEFQTRGLIVSPSTYSDWSTIRTVSVF